MRPQYLIRTLFVVIVFLLSFSALLAQEKQLYSGPFQVANYKGDATYHYSIVEKDTVFDGSFQLQSSNLEALLETRDASFSIKGNFENNYPSGYWTFRFNEFQSDSTSSVEAYRYVVNVSGTQKVASGTLKKGKPDGRWICTVQHIENSQIENITFQSSIEFDNGIPQQSFTIQSRQQELVGRFLRNGTAHDEWTLYSDSQVDPVESWSFNEGLLENIAINYNGDSKIIDIYSGNQAATKVIALDNAYLDILKIKLPVDTYTELSKNGIISLLSQNEVYYKDIDTILSGLGTASFSPQFKIRVPFYPLAANELTNLDSITSNYKKSQTICKTLLEDTQLSILKLSDKNVRTAEASLKAIATNILEPLGQLVNLFENNMLSFVSRNELISKIWPDGIPDASQIGKKEFSFSKSSTTPISYSLSEIRNLSKKTYQYLDSVQQILDKKITRQKREQEAVMLEKKMIAQVEYLEGLQRSLEVDSIPPVFAMTIGSIKENAASKLSAYSGMKNVKAKLDYARELVHCFEKLDKVGETIVQIPMQQYNIRSTYTDAIWNPFTATIMNESIKKRLVNAYENVLIPYFLKEIENGLSCEDTVEWIKLVEGTYERMLALRDEETRKLERKLRKEEDPQVILQRLKIKIKPQKK